MKPKDIFQLITKGVGLITLLYGLDALLEGVLYSLGLGRVEGFRPSYWGVKGMAQGLAGLFLLRGAPFIVDWAFPEEVSDRAGVDTNKETPG